MPHDAMKTPAPLDADFLASLGNRRVVSVDAPDMVPPRRFYLLEPLERDRLQLLGRIPVGGSPAGDPAGAPQKATEQPGTVVRVLEWTAEILAATVVSGPDNPTVLLTSDTALMLMRQAGAGLKPVVDRAVQLMGLGTDSGQEAAGQPDPT